MAIASSLPAVSDWPEASIAAAARCFGTAERIAIRGAHLVGAYHAGPVNLALLQRLAAQGWQVAVPTTLNSSSADLTESPKRASFFCPAYAREHAEASEIVELLTGLGCRPTLSCAPYFGRNRPAFGETFAWAESNAVLFANAVLGARVLRAPQYLDLACALAGEAPLAATLTDHGRMPTAVFDCAHLPRRWFEESAGFELLGLWLGQQIGAGIPLLTGIPPATETQLRSLCAAVGVAADCAMLHVEGQTPEASMAELHAARTGLTASVRVVRSTDLLALRARLVAAENSVVRTVAVGAPHASAEQVRSLLADLGNNRARPRVLLSLGREVADSLPAEIAVLRDAGVRVVRDSCTYYGSFVGQGGDPVLTPSVKWALYARANLGIEACFGSAGECRRALETGRFMHDTAFWRA